MIHKKILTTIGVLEILIGAASFLGVMAALARGHVIEQNILTFLVFTSSISTALGIGILKFNTTAYDLLIYFSSIVVLSKILLFTGIISLNGSPEGLVPASFRNIISVFYHLFLIYYLRSKNIHALFYKPINYVTLRKKVKTGSSI